MNEKTLRAFIKEVLTGFNTLNTTARDGVAGNLHHGQPVSGFHTNILADLALEDGEVYVDEDDDFTIPKIR